MTPYSENAKFRHEEFKRRFRPTRIQTVKAGRHVLRIGFKDGESEVISILHPKGETLPVKGSKSGRAGAYLRRFPRKTLRRAKTR